LDDNRFGAKGAKAIANVLQFNQTIRNISVKYNRIGVLGEKALKNVSKINPESQITFEKHFRDRYNL
jgi:hypothetical protein